MLACTTLDLFSCLAPKLWPLLCCIAVESVAESPCIFEQSHRVCCSVVSSAGRYHEGVQPGDVSQTGQLLVLLLDSVAQRGCYDQQDYCSRLDGLLDTLDGTQYSGMQHTT